ncbi:hypothetical protein YTPLAS18_31650 [Nitrospira sp.]|nr:hypothetical protein YTPLAS18_31650 [Nitrospira sp.]
MSNTLSMSRFILLAGLVLTLLATETLYGESDLTYSDRGSRYEGIKANPVGGGDIELISVLGDYRESLIALPPKFRVRFYLDVKTEVYLRVRELEVPGHFCWLDQVKPERSWDAGYQNEFTWDTATVLAKIRPPIHPHGLGVLVLATERKLRDPEQTRGELS